MGRDVPVVVFSREDRRNYREKVRRCLDVFAQMLRESRFELERPLAGLEIELNIVDADGEAAMRNAEVLAAIEQPDWATELGQFNVEINIQPQELSGHGALRLENDVRARLNHAEERARSEGGHLVLIGILPTLREQDVHEGSLSSNPRYRLLNEQIFAARGEDLHLCIEGVERLDTHADSVAPEAACTSVQLHLQVSPEAFAAHWNAAQAIAGAQVAVAANSPYLFGKELHRETRIALFEQATDTRPAELKAQGVRPRVWFGERWITSVFDLFEENVSYYPALLPLCEDEDPRTELEEGRIPNLHELTLHNGTIYRWNRPVYAVVNGMPHLRVENRVLPAGPTVADVAANAAFYYGLMRVLPDAERPIWSRMSFQAAEDNLSAAARHGLDARLYWPGMGEVPASELILRRLLPMAQEGLAKWGVDGPVADRLLAIIEGRCLTGRTGATWQVERVHAQGGDRHEALRAMTLEYIERMHTNEPAHLWEV
ncbi:gamma-glutamyl:cysteine ligase YbdK (ATP-grasp superfamily) [Nonomuraea polychroma]|uniref:Gamma-glutamyl:cysteine ligase YbdK (ATP-grasp superfamily) n=1 Tax=Nonomuraea polychroma TaxID=46176 RepID=A0A438MP11_9ACTN|nr:glutamate--cysteine ligase [Nonomuraea polychroma]RVX47235.1 gamma-glutamyl:cysteine ligase YbdK (ATP-grasp superfamily) [Nonomuraea polychroma]